MINPLPATWEVVLCTRGALEITRRMLERSPCHQQTKCQEAFAQFPKCQATLVRIQSELRDRTLYEGAEETAQEALRN
jgi:hypothetical protein